MYHINDVESVNMNFYLSSSEDDCEDDDEGGESATAEEGTEILMPKDPAVQDGCCTFYEHINYEG